MTASPIRSILAGLACTLAMSSLGYSQEMIDPAGITATAGSQYASGEFTPSDLLDGMILEGWRNLGTDGPPARPANHQNQHWLSADGIFTETVTFDLGGAYDLTSLMVLNTSNTNWNDSETDTFTIATSTDGGGSYSPPGTEIALQHYTLGFQAVPLVSSGVTHVKLVVTNSQVVDGDANGENLPANEARVGLNEVQFFHLPGGDSDGDGMIDEWEMDNFGDLTRNGSEDEDLPAPDGLSNIREHDLGTDPLDPDSDDDGLTDGDEVDVYGSDPLLTDTDMDTLDDGDEVNIHGSDPTLADTDGDGLTDPAEVNTYMTRADLADTDGDGIDDFEEIFVTMTDPLVANEDPRGTEIDPATITATAGSTFNDTGVFDASNLLDGLIDEGNRDVHRGTHWIAAEGIFTETVTFELGGSYNLVGLEILNTSNTNWNDSETDTLTIAASSDGGASFSAPSEAVALQDFDLGFQAVPFQAAGATHLQLTVTNDQIADGNHLGEDPPAVEARVGLNEVRFFTGPGTPFVITSIVLSEEATGGGATQPVAEIRFNSNPGGTYAVDFSFDLARWFEANDSVPSDGKTTTYIDRDQGVLARPRVYYRIRLAP